MGINVFRLSDFRNSSYSDNSRYGCSEVMHVSRVNGGLRPCSLIIKSCPSCSIVLFTPHTLCIGLVDYKRTTGVYWEPAGKGDFDS